jgi:hypothetical protein
MSTAVVETASRRTTLILGNTSMRWVSVKAVAQTRADEIDPFDSVA